MNAQTPQSITIGRIWYLRWRLSAFLHALAARIAPSPAIPPKEPSR